MLNFDAMHQVGFWSDFLRGLRAYASSFRFLRDHGLRHGYLAVMTGAFAVMKLVGWALEIGMERFELFLMDGVRQRWIHSENTALDDLSNGVFEAFNVGVEGVFFLLTIWVQFKITKFIVLFFLSPIFSLYAELVARKAGMERPANKGLAWSMWRGIRSASLLIMLELTMSIILILMLGVLPLFIPALALVAWGILPFLSAALSTWFYGAALLDLSWDFKGYDVWDSLRSSLRHSGLAWALGLPFFLAMGMPVLGWLIGPLLGGLMGSTGAILSMNEHSDAGSLTEA